MTTPIMVRAQRVRKNFGRVEVLSDLSLSVRTGEVCCIIGPSGSGKSTFLRCINHLEKISGGKLTVDGQLVGYRRNGDKLYELKEREISRSRERVGMVFQSFNLFSHMTAIENVMAGPILAKNEGKSRAKPEAMDLLARVGLADRHASYPRQMSGGQQQRVAIARALAMRPHLMLFDEPTSALDPELVGEVLGVMRDLASEGMTMIIVTHEISFARDVADTLIFMDQGRVVESGTPAELLDNTQQERTREFLSRVR